MDACSCVYVGDYDPADFTDSKVRKARKEHKCTDCSRTIGAGEDYEHVFGVWDGSTHTFKTCKDCLSVRDVFFCEGYVYGGLWELLTEHFCAAPDVDFDCLVELTPRARERVCGMIEEWWEDDDEDEPQGSQETG